MSGYKNPKRTTRDKLILDLATKTLPLIDGQLEMDKHSALISEGGDNGAYVQVWAWVSFQGTNLEKEPEHRFITKLHC